MGSSMTNDWPKDLRLPESLNEFERQIIVEYEWLVDMYKRFGAPLTLYQPLIEQLNRTRKRVEGNA